MIGLRTGIFSGKSSGAPFAWTNTPILDRVNDYIRFNQLIALSGNFSLSVWFKTDSLATNQLLFCGNTAADGSIILAVKPASPQDINFNVSGGAGIFTFSGGVPTNQWNHLFVSRDANNYLNMWLNGVISPSSALLAQTINYSRFGLYFNGAFPFGQNVNEIAIWPGVTGTLTNAQDLYNSGLGAYAYDVIPSPYLYLRCNEGSGTVLTDLGTGATNADLLNVTGTYWGTH